MELIIILLSFLIIVLSIQGVGLKTEFKNVNRKLCLTVFILGSLYFIYLNNSDIIALLLKSILIAAICLGIFSFTLLAQLLSSFSSKN